MLFTNINVNMTKIVYFGIFISTASGALGVVPFSDTYNSIYIDPEIALRVAV